MANSALLLNGAILFTLFAAFLLVFLPGRFGSILSMFAIVLSAGATSCIAIRALTENPVILTLNAGNFAGDILLKIDALSAWFILLINFTVLTGTFFGMGYLKKYALTKSRSSLHFSMFLLFYLSMVLVCMVQNTLFFLIIWEIMSLSSLMLVLFDYEKQSTYKAGLNYFIQMHLGVLFLTIGFIWVYHQSGSFQFDAIPVFFRNNRNVWLFLLFFIGFGIKAGFIPFHSWLPKAHPAAPAHVSGIMSGVMVKIGIYGILRMITFLRSDFLLIGEIIVTISVLTGLYGILNATVHRDFKRMLAYCTLENIGIIGIGIGIGLMGIGNNSSMMYFLGFGGALLHVLNHSLYKSLLFYSAGSIYQQTHTQNIENLGGLIKSMPKTAGLFLTGAIAIAGLPPLNGFISEFIIYNGLIEGFRAESISQVLLLVLTLAGLSVIGGLSVLTFTKSFGTIFLGQPRSTMEKPPVEVSAMMLIPQYIIVLVMLSIAFLPHYYLSVIQQIMPVISPMDFDISQFTSIVKTSANISLYSLLLLMIARIIWLIRSMVQRKSSLQQSPTWGCGYVAPNSRQQYTGKSFSKPLSKIFNFLLIERKEFQEIKEAEIFPKKRSYISHYHDFLEKNLIIPISEGLTYPANYLRFIQNGKIQSYVLYGIVFILAMFILTLFNIVA